MKKKIAMVPVLLFLFFCGSAQTDKFVVGYNLFAAKLSQQRKQQIIDARSAAEFTINHIEGATNIDPAVPGYRQLLHHLSRQAPVFIYSINLGRSIKLAKELETSGYKELYVLKGGIANWIGSGGAYYSAVKNDITPEAFGQLINTVKPVLVEFVLRYCGTCRRGEQIVDSLKPKLDAVPISLLKIDINDNPKLIAALNFIQAVPTFVLYQKGAIVWKKEGIDALPDALSGIITNASRNQ